MLECDSDLVVRQVFQVKPIFAYLFIGPTADLRNKSITNSLLSDITSALVELVE